MIHPHMNAGIDANPNIIRVVTGDYCAKCGHSRMYHRDHGDCTICHCRHFTAAT